jgi:hypothetical protein
MSSNTLLEQFVAQLNESVFLAEFSFSGSEIRIPGTGDLEIADHLVLLEDMGIAYQLKERDVTASSSAGDLSKWFAKKVRKKAVKQMSETREMLRDFQGKKLRNHLGHEIPLATSKITKLYSVVVYRMPTIDGFAPSRVYDSRSAGFVHFIRDTDYLAVCQHLLTPAEIADYLDFRRSILVKWPSAAGVSETALVGQYFAGDHEAEPASKYQAIVGAIQEHESNWSMSHIFSKLGSKVTYREGDQSETSHYRILTEFAKLSRSELREFKLRFELALDAARADRYELPYRMACPRTDCGFLILPVTSEDQQFARIALRNLSLASKHEFGVRRHVSLSVSSDAPDFNIEWMYVDSSVAPNPELDAKIQRDAIFRSTSDKQIPRYLLSTDVLRRVFGDAQSG